MTDHRSAYDDGELPWLQAVEDEDEPRGVSARKMFAALAVVLLAALLVAATFFWLGQREAQVTGPPELIRAEAGPYKVPSNDRGNLNVAGESQTAFETSAGEDRDAQLNLEALPETPVAKPPKAPEAAAPGGEAAAQPAEAAATGGSGSVIQLGAFQNQAQAERAWAALSARFPTIGGMNKMIIPFSGGIRLRAGAASSDAARQACQTLKAAGENCFVAR